MTNYYLSLTLLLAMSEVFVLYTLEEAKREAQYYYEKLTAGHIESNYGEHKWFTIQRLCVFFFTFLAALSLFPGGNHFILSLITTLSLWCCFPFLHDLAYYVGRNRLDRSTYPNPSWRTQSRNSQAWLDRIGLDNPYTRLILLIAGVLLFLAVMIYQTYGIQW